MQSSTFRVLAVVCLLAFSCTSKKELPTEKARLLNLAVWSNYVSPQIVAQFEKRTGIHVQIANYSSNEELLAKLQAGASGYDVAVPSDYMVFAMSKLGLLKELDSAQLPQVSRLDPKFLKKPFDPTNKYSVPFDWGTTGLAVNRTLFTQPVRGWKDVFGNPALKGKFTLLDDVRESIGAALKAQGLSLNTRNPKDLEKAKVLLLKIRPQIKAFTSEPKMELINGESAVAHSYSSDALQAAAQTQGKVAYLIPEEGGTLWIDNLVIPATAPHPKEAYLFINYLIEAKTELGTTQVIFVAPSNLDALDLLPPDMKSNRAMFPTDDTLSKLEMMQDLGEATSLWDRVWTEVKAKSE